MTPLVLLQVGAAGAWWTSGWFWVFILLLIIATAALVPWSWRSPRRRR